VAKDGTALSCDFLSKVSQLIVIKIWYPANVFTTVQDVKSKHETSKSKAKGPNHDENALTLRQKYSEQARTEITSQLDGSPYYPS